MHNGYFASFLSCIFVIAALSTLRLVTQPTFKYQIVQGISQASFGILGCEDRFGCDPNPNSTVRVWVVKLAIMVVSEGRQ